MRESGGEREGKVRGKEREKAARTKVMRWKRIRDNIKVREKYFFF